VAHQKNVPPEDFVPVGGGSHAGKKKFEQDISRKEGIPNLEIKVFQTEGNYKPIGRPRNLGVWCGAEAPREEKGKKRGHKGGRQGVYRRRPQFFPGLCKKKEVGGGRKPKEKSGSEKRRKRRS